MSIQAYQKAQAAAESPRDAEYRAFTFVTRMLTQAQSRGREDLKGLVEAVAKNRELWTILATDCGAPGNRLPDALRAGIISLSLFVHRHSSAVIRGEGDIESLIDVNRSIMQGLAPASAAAR